jgi:hypothetical protein
MKAEPVTYLRHEAQPINEFGVALALFLANTVGDDMSLAGKPARDSGGLARSLPQRLFGYTQCCLNEVEKCDSHNRLLDLVSSNSFRSNPVAVARFQMQQAKG